MRTGITTNELFLTLRQLKVMRGTVAWYNLTDKFRYDVMITTIAEIINWIGQQPVDRSCGCSLHTDPGAN